MNEVETIDQMMPDWFPNIGNSTPVFGKRKDKLIRDILDLRGMDLLERECGFRFVKDSQPKTFQTELKQLINIKRRLLKRRTSEFRVLAKATKADVKFCKANKEGTILMAKIESEGERKRGSRHWP
jgi:phage regulator Rha-like protein